MPYSNPLDDRRKTAEDLYVQARTKENLQDIRNAKEASKTTPQQPPQNPPESVNVTQTPDKGTQETGDNGSHKEAPSEPDFEQGFGGQEHLEDRYATTSGEH